MDDSASQLGEPLPVPVPPVAATGLNAPRAFALLLAYVLAQFMISLVVVFSLAIYYYSRFSLDQARLFKWLQTPTVLISTGTLAILGAAWLVVHMTRRFFAGTPRTDAYRLLGLSRASPRHFVGGALLGLFLALLFAVVATKFLPPGPGHPIGPLARAAASGGLPRVLWAILAVIIAPPIEEFLFRGALYAGFEKSWGRATAILLVSVTFVLLHIFEARAYWPSLVAITLVALALIAVRIRSESLGPAIMLHAYYNLGLVITVFTLSGHS